MDDAGYGCAVYAVDTGPRTYSLVAFSTPLDDSRRTDRVIAEAWDTSYVLYDGAPDADEVERLRANAPLQEAGRYGAARPRAGARQQERPAVRRGGRRAGERAAARRRTAR